MRPFLLHFHYDFRFIFQIHIYIKHHRQRNIVPRMRTVKAIFLEIVMSFIFETYRSGSHLDHKQLLQSSNKSNIVSILQNESTGCCVDCPQGGACDVFHRLLTVNRLSEDVGHKAVPPLHLGNLETYGILNLNNLRCDCI